MLSIGVDGCPGGWVAVVLEDERFADAVLFGSFHEMAEAWPEAAAIGVDIPIGLPEERSRAADGAARDFLPPARRSSVFLTPPRAVLTAASYAEARLLQPSTSAQSYALGARILEVERSVAQNVYEVHPEVSFFALARKPLRSKRTAKGIAEREAALESAGIVPPDRVDGVPRVDLLDAAAAAWSARRVALGRASTLPDDPPTNQQGRLVAIWY